MKSEAKKMDMLGGTLADKLLLFAIPLAASSILQQLFNAVDVAVVGHFAQNPAEATAAVGCNSSVINLIINLFVGISVGANVVVSNFIGAQDRKSANKAVHTAMTLAAISGVFLLFLGLAVSRPLLTAMNTPEAVLPYALQYLRIYVLGMPFIMVYNFGAAILRSIGDTKRPLFCLVLSGILNAALNLFLVIVFHLDVAGVAIATVISNVISSMMVIIFLMRERSEIRLEPGKLGIDRRDLVRILRIGVPAGLQSMVFSLSNVIIQSVLNSFGTQAVAGSAVALNYENFSYFVVSSFTQATVTFTSQNYGAGNYDRCRKIFRLCITMAMASAFCMSWIFILGRSFFTSVFTSDPEVQAYAILRMETVLSLYLFIATYEIGGAALRGIGYSMTPALFTIFGTCVFRLIWAFSVSRVFHDFRVLMVVYPVSWILTGAAVLTAYFIIRKKALSPAKPRIR